MTTLHQSLSASVRNLALEEAAALCDTGAALHRAFHENHLAAAMEEMSEAIRSLKTEE